MLQLIGKYINNTLIIISLLIVFIFLIIFSFFPSLLNSYANIEKVSIVGNDLSSRASIIKTINEYGKKSLFYFPLEQYQTKIETLDWVKRALIKRKFPNTIEVTIIENLPFAVFINGINQYLIDEDGDIISLYLDSEDYKDFLKVTGQEANLNFSKLIRDINVSYPEIINNIIEVEFIERRRWNLILKDKLKIKLPEKESSYQLEKLKQLQQDQKIFSTNIIEIDLREKGRATIKVPGGEELKTGLDEV